MKKQKKLNNLNVAAGSVIKKLRNEEGWSQTELARRVGVSYQQIQKYEWGKTSLSLRRLRSIAIVFKMKTPALVERIEKRL